MRDFFKYTLASFLGSVLFVGTASAGFILLIVILFSAFSTGEPKTSVAEDSILVLDLATKITDAPQPGDDLQSAISGQTVKSISARMLKNVLERAADDPNIVGVYLQGSSGVQDAGYATLKDVRDGLSRFHASGKKIIAYDTEWTKPEYYLASMADTIAMNPFGAMELNGLRAETPFFANALQKFGIGVQVTRVGKYKSAVEPFLSNQRSSADLEQSGKLLNDIWGDYLSTVGRDRKLNPETLRELSDRQGFLTAESALKEKLITTVAYQDEVNAQLKELTGESESSESSEDSKRKNSFRQVSLQTYAKEVKNFLATEQVSKPKIAVLYAEGEIVNGEGMQGSIGSDRFADELRKLREDKSIRAIVLRVNSPGGSVTASDEIQREVILTQMVKPVVVSMGTYAASGGYWIATYSDRIFAQPNTITGSIGVFGLLLNIQKISNDNGITWDVIKTSSHADLDTISRPKTAQEIALLQTEVDRIYDQFLVKVATSRKLSKTKVAEIAQGRVWSGLTAQKLGLVDEIGGLDAAIKDAAKRSKLQDGWQVVEYPKVLNWKEEFLKQITDDSESVKASNHNLLLRELQKLQRDLAVLTELHDPLNIYVRLPYRFDIQ